MYFDRTHLKIELVQRIYLKYLVPIFFNEKYSFTKYIRPFLLQFFILFDI